MVNKSEFSLPDQLHIIPRELQILDNWKRNVTIEKCVGLDEEKFIARQNSVGTLKNKMRVKL